MVAFGLSDTNKVTKQDKELKDLRKQWFDQMEQKLQEMHTKEDDSLFYYHSSEDLIPAL